MEFNYMDLNEVVLPDDQMPAPKEIKTALYRHFNGEDLLYIGISLSHINRLKDHTKYSYWADEITRIEIEYFGSRSLALRAEAKAIHTELPKYNIHHNWPLTSKDPKPVLELIDGERAALTYKVTTIKPIYRLHELHEFGIGKSLAERLIASGKLSSLKQPSPKNKAGFRYVVSGWQLLDYMEFIHATGWSET
tara:strand:+ start:272 stop:850 length:579 start_codon:yes stop_codon:yes gene_type:complete